MVCGIICKPTYLFMKKRSSFWLMSCAFPLLTACNAGSAYKSASADSSAVANDFRARAVEPGSSGANGSGTTDGGSGATGSGATGPGSAGTSGPSAPGLSDGFTMPLLIRSADLNLTVTDLNHSAQKIRGWLENQGGYYSQWVQARQDDTMGITLTAKVPASRFEPFKDSIETLGNVQLESVDAADVTDTYEGNQGRAAVSQKVGGQYKAIGEKAAKAVDALTAEARVEEALRSEEESKEGLATLHRQIAAGTLRIRLSMFSPLPPMEKPAFGQRLFGNLGDGWEGVGNILLFFAEIWPLVVLIVVGAVLWRRYRRVGS